MLLYKIVYLLLLTAAISGFSFTSTTMPSMASPRQIDRRQYRARQRRQHAVHYSKTSDATYKTEHSNSVKARGGEENKSLFWPSNKRNKMMKQSLKQKGVEEDMEAEAEAEEYYEYDDIFDSIVKIYATHNKEPEFSMPWQKTAQYTSTSSGFVIAGRRILTNAHSVEYTGQVLVRRRGSSNKFQASVQVVANECDLAILTIEDESFWITDYDDEDVYESNDVLVKSSDTNDTQDQPIPDAILPLEFGELPDLQDEVEVLGYPTGGDSLSVTKGVVSRIEATEYAQCSGSHQLAIQIDAAINGGNSGGPVVDASNGKVVGVAFQSLEQAENIGYVVPITVVLHFLEDIRRNNKYSGVTCLGVKFARLENQSMRDFLKLPKENNTRKSPRKTADYMDSPVIKGGVMVRSCNPTCPSRHILKSQDVILSIDGIPISSDGNIPFRRGGRERVSYASYIQTKFCDQALKLDIWRDGALLPQVDVPLAISQNLVPSHWNNKPPPYLIVGGLVFTALSVPYLEDHNAWSEFYSDNISYLTTKMYEPLEREDDQLVILVNVLPHPTNMGYGNYENMHLQTCNDQKVRSLHHLNQLISEQKKKQDGGKEDFLRFEFGSSGLLVVLETKLLEEITQEVCKEHSIQKPYYLSSLAMDDTAYSRKS